MGNTIGTAYVQIEPSAKGISDSITKAINGSTGSMSSALGSAFKTAGKVAATSLVAATGAATAFGKSAVDAGKEFDASMSQVAATMGFTTEEMNKEGSATQQTFQKLRDFAQEMGSTTAFSATEAADALNYMALAGYDADTAMSMLPTVLNLAAAGGIDLASASDMVTDAQTALGLTLDETRIMVDQMASASSSSNTSVEQLGEAFLKIGANARNLSGGTEELSTILGVLADNGIKGTEAGTHLRNIMLAMNPTTDKAANAWEELGVQAYDADGNLRPLQDTFADLSKAMEGMTDQEKTQTIAAMFNKTDLASINALLETSTERYNELSNTIDSSTGAAQNMADVQLDNLAGDITLFQSALEGAKIAVSDGLTPVLREFVQFGSGALSQMTESFKTGGIEGLMTTLGEVLSNGLNKLVEDLPAIANAGIKLLESLIQGLVDNLPLIVSATVEILQMFGQSIIDNLPMIGQAALDIILQLSNGLIEALPTLIPTMVQVILSCVNGMLDNLDLIITAGLQLITALIEGIIQALPQLIDEMPIIIERVVEALVQNLPQIIACGIQLLIALLDGIIQTLPRLITFMPQIISAIVGGLINGIADMVKVGGDLIDGLWKGIQGSWGRLKENASGLISGLVGQFKTILKIGSPSKVMADEVGKWLPEGLAVGIEANADSAIDAMDTMGAGITSSAQNDLLATGNAFGSTMSEANGQDGLYGLLATYLPMIAQNGGVTLEGDAANLFKVIKNQNNIYKKSTGVSAFA